MNNFLEKCRGFFDGYLYPISLGAIVLICHLLSLEFLAILLIFASVAFALVVYNDMRVAISPILFILFSFSFDTYKSGWLKSTAFLVLAIIAIILFVSGVIAHLVINKKLSRFKKLHKSRLFIGFVALACAFLLNGFFNFKSYEAINFTFALLLVLFLAVVFFLLYCGIEEREDTVEYLIFILYVASLIVVLEMLAHLAFGDVVEGGRIIKERLFLGWGAWNNVGGMLAMLLPIHFYYASTKKHGYIYYGTAILTYITIVLTLSRSSLLFASIVSAICVAIICIKGSNKKINRIITICLAGIALIGVIVLWNKISTLLSSYLNQGFDDNGRFNLYKHGVENFLSHPIFGGGFGSCMEDHFGYPIDPNRYHNTFIELLATCGIVGFGAYVFHRYQTIKLVLERKKQLSVVFLSLCIVALLLTSLLDNHFFNLYPTMFYSVILCVIEKCSITDKQK